MGHEDIGHFADKHPKGTQIDQAVEDKINQHRTGDELTCTAAHAIAEELCLSPAQVGIAMDLMEIRIGKCQMGLFGYRPQKRIVKPAQSIAPQLEQAIHGELVDDRISCLKCWQLADEYRLRKIDVASVCEALQIKINQCQLGAF